MDAKTLDERQLPPLTLPRDFELPGGYVIEEPLGAGGFGDVYAGRDPQLDRPVAIKVLSRTLEEGVMRRFRDEGRLLARLQHPNIIQVYTFGALEDQRAYLVMERFGSGSISAHWKRGEHPTVELAVSIIAQVLEALSAAHEAGVIHRDIKEANILYCERTQLVKLCDFGIARSLTPLEDQAETTQEGMIIGSVPYIAPERLKGARGDERSDLYAVGVLMCRLLTGHRPFEAQAGERLDPQALMMKTLLEEPYLPSSVPPRWRRLCLALLAKAPHQRPKSAASALQMLSDALALSGTVSAQLSGLSLERPLSVTPRLSRGALRLSLLLIGALAAWLALSSSARVDQPSPPERHVIQLGPQLKAKPASRAPKLKALNQTELPNSDRSPLAIQPTPDMEAERGATSSVRSEPKKARVKTKPSPPIRRRRRGAEPNQRAPQPEPYSPFVFPQGSQ